MSCKIYTIRNYKREYKEKLKQNATEKKQRYDKLLTEKKENDAIQIEIE